MSDRRDVICSTCDEVFATRGNHLAENQTCPDCFTFPDVDSEAPPRDTDYNVYLVARIQAPPYCGVERNYYRIAAKSEADAMWFAEAFCELQYDGDTSSLAELEIDESGEANTHTYPLLVAHELPDIDFHDGYAVNELGFRGGSADVEEQEYIYGPNTTDKINHMTPEEYQDVLVHATEEQIDHKLAENVPDDHICYWTVSGKPQKTRHRRAIWFENDGEIVARGVVHSVETGRIWFYPVERVEAETDADAPTRGFTYVDREEIKQLVVKDGGRDE